MYNKRIEGVIFMFVPYEPQLLFDVKRLTDRCVCGASATRTKHEGINNGYCPDCAKKRTEFVNKIIGSIEISTSKANTPALDSLEKIRKNILQERFCYMIDSYFALHQNENFSEPYEDLSFIEKVYREKQCLTTDLILPAFKTYITSDNEKIGNPRLLEKYEKKIKRCSRELSRRIKGSNNYNKTKKKKVLANALTKRKQADRIYAKEQGGTFRLPLRTSERGRSRRGDALFHDQQRHRTRQPYG